MSTDIEELLRDGMERFTAGVRAPAGLAAATGARRRRRRAVRAVAACGTAAVTAAAVALAVAATGGTAARTGGQVTQAREVAYLVSRVKAALATENLVFYGRTASTAGPSATWAYGHWYRFEEFTGTGCGHAAPSGDCTHRGGSERYLATGTARAGRKLADAYVTYYNREYSLSPLTTLPASACSRTARLEMAGPLADPGDHWSNFISATLACGAATVTGQVRIDGRETTKITGTPLTVRLSPGYARTVHEKWVQVRWALYVDPTTYLPVRITGSTATYGGTSPRTAVSGVTDVQWLPPTAANKARALVEIPAGFHRVSSAASQ